MECCSTGEGAGGELGPRGEGRSRRDAESMVDAQWIAVRPSYVHAVSMRPLLHGNRNLPLDVQYLHPNTGR